MKKLYLFSIAALLILGACSKSLEDKYNQARYEKDIESLFNDKLIDEHDKDLLTNYIVVNQFDSLALAKSYGEILDVAKGEELIAQEKAERQKQLNEAITATIIKKHVRNYSDGEYVVMDLSIKNNTDKTICGSSIKINFKNNDGNVFYTSQWLFTTVIKPNLVGKGLIGISRNNAINSNEQDGYSILRVVDLSKIQVEYEIMKVIYDDGTLLEQ
jgi:hypothetical protein